MQSLTTFLWADLVPQVLPFILGAATDQKPEDEDVKAGWTAFAIFILLILAVAFLGFSLTKQLRRVEAAKVAGVYGDVPEADADADGRADGHVDGAGQTGTKQA